MDEAASSSTNSKRDRTIALLLALLFLFIYILTAQGSIQSLDGTIMYEVTQSLVEKGSVAIGNPAGVRGVDGRLYSKYGLGQSLVAVPFYLAGKLVASLLPLPFATDYAKKFFVSMLNPLVTALTCALLYAFAVGLGYSRRATVLAVLLFGLGSMAWPYSQTFYSESLTSFLLLGMFYLLMGENLQARNLLLAGALCGAAVLTRTASLVVFLPSALYLFLTSDKPEKAGKRFLLFFIPLSGALLASSFYNYYRFGNILESGYQSEAFTTPLVKGLYGFLLSPGRGVFWYNPLLAFSFLGFPLLWRAHRDKSFALLLFVLLHLLLYSQWGAWEGGWVWGPRFLLVVVPYLIIFSLPWIEKVKTVKAATVLVILAVASIAIQFSAVIASPERYYYQEYTKDPEKHMARIIYDISYSPLLAQWKSVAVVMKNVGERGFLRELARRQGDEGLSEELKGKAYFLSRNLAFNSPNLWLLYLWYAGASRWLVLGIATFLLATIGFSGWGIMSLLRS